MTARELKDKFVKFFSSQQHVEIPSSSLIPENDPSTLFISAGMHPLVPYLLGQRHPLGKRLVNVQKCLRTGDIDEVGDAFHHTFFEMLGNWSLGDYFKKEMIPWSYQLLTQELNINPDHLHITCFAGDGDAPKDKESSQLWLEQGIKKENIHFLPKKDNWWGPAGQIGPCGPDTEIFIDTQAKEEAIDFKKGSKSGRYVEIWNDVFMEYNKKSNGKFESLPQKNVDTGMGVERTVAVLSGLSDNYLSSVWQPIIKTIEETSAKKYSDKEATQSIRIIADHIKAAVFMIADGVEPSNKEAGYVLRRLIRRSIRQGKLLGIEENFLIKITQVVLGNQDNYAGTYPELNQNKDKIISTIEAEENRFRKTLNRGLSEINKLIKNNKEISGRQAFTLYESFGFPVEMIQEELQKKNLELDLKEFEKAKEEHQQKSKTLSAGKFKSGLADDSQVITQYHTLTHLLHTSLRKILGDHVQQAGSNITSERLRFDFTHPQKLTDQEVKEIQDLINQQIDKKIDITKETMLFTDAQKAGALAFFKGKYPDKVTVFTVGDFSKEVCTGPHVANTKELKKIKIIKEESAGASKRRLYATFE